MISRTLQTLNGQGRLTVRQFEEATGLSDSTFYRWLGGESEPTFIAIHQLIAHHPDEDVRLELLHCAMRGSGFIAVPAAGADDLDVNHDGRVNALDALASANGTIKSMADLGQELHEAAACEKQVLPSDAARFRLHGSKARRGIDVAISVIEQMSEGAGRRRKARPVAIGGGE